MTDTIFNPETLQVGDIFYRVKERNQFFTRKKIHKEIDGVDWFRYDRPVREYKISTYTIIGILEPILRGKWPDDESFSLETEYYVETDEGHTFTTYFDEDKFFSNYDDAVSHMKKLEDQAKEMDMPWPNHQ